MQRISLAAAFRSVVGFFSLQPVASPSVDRFRSSPRNKRSIITRSHRRRFRFETRAVFLALSGPRWASWNLGVFICIRCAGIHRNLGVHISRVKSVNLDQWTSEQIQVLFSYLTTLAQVKSSMSLILFSHLEHPFGHISCMRHEVNGQALKTWTKRAKLKVQITHVKLLREVQGQ